uniref:hypothetical protein n=1 Tax=Vibrio cholerae TaxID=666 RepID=UPI0011102DE9
SFSVGIPVVITGFVSAIIAEIQLQPIRQIVRMVKFKASHHQSHNKRLKRDCQRVAFPVPLSRGGFGCCV